VVLRNTNKVLRLWDVLSSSFWFVPVLIVAFAILMATLLIGLDGRVPVAFIEDWPTLFVVGPEGARAVLSSIAGSMMTVAGVVFSITLVALSLASSQYSPRVLRSFMRDRTTQVVLGVFVGIFSYCEVVLRSVGSDPVWVPSISVLMALVLGVVGVFVLVLFIHHIATSIQASQILARIYQETMEAMERSMPEGQEIHDEDEIEAPLPTGPGWTMVMAEKTGYLASLGTDQLREYAEEHDQVLWTTVRIGEFVMAGTPVLAVATTTLSDEAREHLGEAFGIQAQRTLTQDMTFGIRQMVDVALKALSPGINDSTTAVMAVDYITAVLHVVASRALPSRLRSDDGTLRVVVRGSTFDRLLSDAYDQIRQNAPGNTAVLARLAESIAALGLVTTLSGRRRSLLEKMRLIEEAIDETVPNEDDRDRLRELTVTSRSGLEHPTSPVEISAA